LIGVPRILSGLSAKGSSGRPITAEEPIMRPFVEKPKAKPSFSFVDRFNGQRLIIRVHHVAHLEIRYLARIPRSEDESINIVLMVNCEERRVKMNSFIIVAVVVGFISFLLTLFALLISWNCAEMRLWGVIVRRK
jgi:hypothetical protein